MLVRLRLGAPRNKMHKCYLHENAGKLKELRQLEAVQRLGKLKQFGYFRLIELKEQLGL